MTNRTRRLVAAVAVVAALAGVAAAEPVLARYRQDTAAARERVRALGSRVAQTACGPIEYASVGEGYPVLEVHGIFGGFDQGLVDAEPVLGEGFRLIAPSRFGYLRTPMPDDASVGRQAEAHRCLLDHLGVERAAVVAHSAGATSAVDLALRYPERVSALVLVVPVSPGPETATPPKALVRLLFASDFPLWLLATYAPSVLPTAPPTGLPLTAADRAEMARVMQTIAPAAPRGEGFRFDAFVSNRAINGGYRFGDIAVPTLVVAAKDDQMASPDGARALADVIPGARFHLVERGGHLLLGQSATVGREITNFLRLHTTAPVA
jgi:pimeloyl-ACP methyl ester carboxylesterase